MNALRLLSSLKLTLVGMLALGGAVLFSYYEPSASPLWVAAPLILMALNLMAAMLVRRSFRRKPGLIVFHLGLLAVMLLAAAGRLNSFTGRIEISEGQLFDMSAVTVVSSGPWHSMARLAEVRFEQADMSIDYAPGLRRGATLSTVHAPDEAGHRKPLTVGDTRPFRSDGYRFYTTSNKGYAAVISWTDESGATQRGAVHFPSYPFYEWKQLNQWTTPAGLEVELEFHPAGKVELDRHWVLDSAETAGSLTVRVAGREPRTLRPSESIRLPDGVLRYDEPRMWMGYEIFYDPMLPWLLMAALVGVLGLAWHYWNRFQPRTRAADAGVSADVERGAYAAGH